MTSLDSPGRAHEEGRTGRSWSRLRRQNPRHTLTGAAEVVPAAPRDLALDHYAFEVGAYTDGRDGDDRAKRLLEARRVGARAITGRVDHPIAAGKLVRLRGHRRASVDGEYIVIESRFMLDRHGEQAATIRAIPRFSTELRVGQTSDRRHPYGDGRGAPVDTVDLDETAAWRWHSRAAATRQPRRVAPVRVRASGPARHAVRGAASGRRGRRHVRRWRPAAPDRGPCSNGVRRHASLPPARASRSAIADDGPTASLARTTF